MSPGRSSRTSIGLLLCLVTACLLLPAGALGAGSAPPATYIVTLKVPDAGEALRTTSHSARVRLRQRAAATRETTDRVVRDHAITPSQRYTTALTGFAAHLTGQQAAELARDGRVADVRRARVFQLAASQVVPPGVRRVRAQAGDGSAPDVDADIAIIDTGIGPVGGDELDVRGGINCTNDGLGPRHWEDVYWDQHGTHVAGIAAARDNDRGVVGVAPGARLWSVRVFDGLGYGDEAGILCGLDWVTRTVTGPAPEGSQPIEVVNMSLEAPRASTIEDCAALGRSDPLHTAVCQATEAGITIVAAAGNISPFFPNPKASSVVPGAYDQVITVGAINDYDGAGGGGGRRPAGCSGGTDDRYATYSKVGPDIDILAPGTCVRSTLPDPARAGPAEGGTFTQTMSGTSQATPHVTGAVARYLAARPGTSPEQMRRIVRAAGRLDWDIRSDPMWSGVDDADAPSRLLDTAALLGPADVTVWLSQDRFRVAGSGTRRQVRVDVQRGGAYAGPLELSVTGLPDEVGSAAFDRPGRSLDGLADLGARLRFTLPVGGRQGPRTLSVVAAGSDGTPTGSRALDLVVDRKGPRVTGLAARIRGGDSPLDPGGRIPAVVSWSVRDALSPVAQVTAQRRIGTSRWRSMDRSGSRARISLVPGGPVRVRVRARDSLGNHSTSATLPLRLVVRDSSSPSLAAPAGGWSTTAAATARGGSLVVADETSSSLVTDFHGTSVALLAPIGPQRGRLRVRIDEGPWQEVDLRAPHGRQQRIVEAGSVPAGDHRLEIQRVRGLVAVDAVLILD